MLSTFSSEYMKNKDIGSQPWPDAAVLYQPYEEEQILLAENASCLAVRTYLIMLNLPFKVEQRANAEFMSPGGKRTKLPVLQVENFINAEFEQILHFVEQKGYSLSKNIDENTKKDIRTYVCLVENIFTNAEQYISWVDTEVRKEVTFVRNGCVYPFPLNHIQNFRKLMSARRQLGVNEYLNLSLENVIKKVEKLCKTLSNLLGDQKYFCGAKPIELDALVFGHLFSIFTMTLPNDVLAVTINKYENLIRFCKNINAEYFNKARKRPT
ncbi:metaxin-2-like [Uranotaenia lowii]|uniref:metaxin-2-like n=1 Tax=Uranotaenia lowii TaxID=190385 RepID=UPI00247A615D|nr:metaxin-2-like [Uranotaenia lowii]